MSPDEILSIYSTSQRIAPAGKLIEHFGNAVQLAAIQKTQSLFTDSEIAIRALREYIQALPDDVVAQLPAMPRVDGDWLDKIQDALKTSISR